MRISLCLFDRMDGMARRPGTADLVAHMRAAPRRLTVVPPKRSCKIAGVKRAMVSSSDQRGHRAADVAPGVIVPEFGLRSRAALSIWVKGPTVLLFFETCLPSASTSPSANSTFMAPTPICQHAWHRPARQRKRPVPHRTRSDAVTRHFQQDERLGAGPFGFESGPKVRDAARYPLCATGRS